MTGEGSFRARLRAVIDNITAPGRRHTQAIVDGHVQAGATSDEALLDLIRDRRVADGLRANGCWLLGRLASRGGTEVLVQLLGDASVDVRAEAAASPRNSPRMTRRSRRGGTVASSAALALEALAQRGG